MGKFSFHAWYLKTGKSCGYDMPRIVSYHTGRFKWAIMLQAPGGPLAGSGAQASGEIGALDNDSTARFIRDDLDVAELSYEPVVPLTALPDCGFRNINAERQREAMFNSEALRQSGSNRLLDFSGLKVVYTHRPSTRGHNSRGTNEVGRSEWRAALRDAIN